MLGSWRNHKDYCSFVTSTLLDISITTPHFLYEYEDQISKLFILNLDFLKDIISPLYSHTGRPSHFQPEIFRSFVLMNSLKIPLDRWIHKLKHNPVLQTTIGITSDNIPSVSSHYDFINRLINFDDCPRIKSWKRKPSKKLGKNKKLPNRHKNIVARLVDKITAGRSFSRRTEKTLQSIFARVAVDSSVALGIVPKSLDLSGDGTCIKTGASPYGVKICDCKNKNIYNCDCNRKFSDPNATWGWDSSKEIYFYGYTGYFLSTYSSELNADIPLYLRLVDAKRHDSVSAVVALNEFRELYSNIKVNTFIHDAACDNYATYKLLDKWDINAVIALNTTNKGKFSYPKALSIDKNGVPICPNGNQMLKWGFDKERCRIKYRCPLACGKISSCDNKVNCSPSEYGRTIYVKPSWDLRLFTKIPRGSDLWIKKMKSRTSIERLNNRILNHYGVESSKVRGKKRISFFTMLAGFNIHLDIQLRFLKAQRLFDFNQFFANSTMA